MKKKQFYVYLLAAAMTLGAVDAEAKSICLDPGHGGADPGALGCGMTESYNTLDSVKRLEALLKAAGWTVYLTRSTETTVDLLPRSNYANSKGVDTFASIHNNAFNGSATGIETLCQTGNLPYKSGSQAKKIQNRMLAVWSLANRNAKEQNLSVTRNTNMPATLSELAFIDNCSKDAPYLKARETHVQEAMRAHCRAITELWDGSASSKCESSGGGSTEPPTPPSSTGKLMAGTFHDSVAKENWLGGVKYSVGGKSQTSASEYTMMTFELAPGTYKATAEKSGYNTASKDCEAVTAGGTAWCSLALTAAQTTPTKGKATGSVKDGASSKKIAATVSANSSNVAYDGKTDWSFELKAGTYTIMASADGYDDGSVSCVVTAGNSASCPITLNPKKGTITGQVLDSSTNNIIAATVKLGSQTVQYKGSGEYAFTVDEGSYTLEADAEGFNHNQVTCKASKGQSTKCDISLTPATETTKTGTIKGTLADAVSGTLIAGEVTIDGQVYHYMGSGEYQFTLAPGEYTVTGSATGYNDKSEKCTVASDKATDCPIKLTAKDTTVSGYVFPASDRTSRVAATVTLDDDGVSQTVQYDGKTNWTMSVAPGSYTFNAVTADGDIGYATCKLEAGKTNVCNIAVAAADTEMGSLTGIVHDSRNKKLYLAAQVEVEGYGSVEYDGETKFHINDLPIGEYNVTAEAAGYYSNTVVCEVSGVEPGYCEIPLTIKPENGAEEVPNKPSKIVIDNDSCSAQPLAQNHSLPAGIAALFLGMLTAFGIRRRKGDER